jgi:hypothetical protein
MADHEDYLSGEAPMAHHESHESLGSDKISVAGLLGVTAELAAHALIATAHQDAPGLIAAHALIAAAHHARYTDVEATIIANAQIAIHAALPTAHQNAPALIATHAAIAAAHHAKYTDADARAAINNIFGADGKADSDIDLDSHSLQNTLQVIGGNVFHSNVDIVDDDFFSFTPYKDIGVILINARAIGYRTINAMITYRCPAPSFAEIICQSGAEVAVTTGALDGTTGTDGKFTISPHTDSKIYIENRRGTTISIGITLLGN